MSHRCVVDVADDTGALRIRVIGEVDIECTSSLQQTIASADVPPSGRVLFDTAELAFIDSAGISAIIDAHMRAAADGIAITLVEVPPLVRVRGRRADRCIVGVALAAALLIALGHDPTPVSPSHRSPVRASRLWYIP